MVDVVRFFDRRQQGLRHISSKLRPTTLKLDFLVQRLACRKSDAIPHGYEEQRSPPFVCKFRRDSVARPSILASANENGDVYLLDADASDNKVLLHKWSAHENAVFDICWEPHEPKIFTSSGDNSIAYWDAMGKQIRGFCNHTGSVKCIDVCPVLPSIFASGGRDGKICVWDTRVDKDPAKPEITITNAHSPNLGQENDCKKNRVDLQNYRSVTSVAFQDEHLLASAGVGDQVIKFWDLRKTYVLKPKKNRMHTAKHMLKYYGDGCTHMVFDSTYKNLFASCTNSVIYQYSCHTYNSTHVRSYNGHKVRTYFTKIALSGDDQYLLSGSGDDHAYIWKVDGPCCPIVRLQGHDDEVTGTAWHPTDLLKLATCGDDGWTLIWKVASEEDTLANKDAYVGIAKPAPSDYTVQMTSLGNGHSSDNRKPGPIFSSAPLNTTVTIKHFFSSLPITSTGMYFPFRDGAMQAANNATDVSSPVIDKTNSPNHASRHVLSSTMLCSNEENIIDYISTVQRTSRLDGTENSCKRDNSEALQRKCTSLSPFFRQKGYPPTPCRMKRSRRSTGCLKFGKRACSTGGSPQNRSIKSYFLESP